MTTVVVTAIGSFAADIVIKNLKKTGCRVVGCDIYPKEWIADASQVAAFYQVPLATEEKYIGAVLDICQKEEADYLFPLTDLEVDAWNRHRQEAKEKVVVCMSSKEAIDICRDKARFSVFMAQRGMPGAMASIRLSQASPRELAYPVVCKPYNGRSSQGLRFIQDEKALERLKEEVDPNGYLVQKRIEGWVVTVDVVRQDAGGACAAIARRELLRTPSGAGTSVMVYHDPCLEERCQAMAEALAINGCVNFEFIRDPMGEFHLLECNPRFSGGVEFSCMAGYDMVANHLRCFQGEAIQEAPSVPTMYIARKYEEYITRVE